MTIEEKLARRRELKEQLKEIKQELDELETDLRDTLEDEGAADLLPERTVIKEIIRESDTFPVPYPWPQPIYIDTTPKPNPLQPPYYVTC